MGEMQPKSDAQLLRNYAECGAESAFTELVQRHTNLVYSAALRQVDSPDIAAEIAQNVFVALARSARDLSPRLAAEASLAGWLCRSARNLSLNHRRDEFRRQSRERQAMEQLLTISDDAPDWDRLRRVLDDAMSELTEADYDALVLRFFQKQDFRDVGAALGVSDDTAQKRVSRALEKLREFLSQRGIRSTAATLSVVISANAVQAAPVGLAATISAAALAGTAVSTSTLIAAATKTIAMTTLQKTLLTATVAVLAGAGVYEAHQCVKLREQVQMLQQQQIPRTTQIQELQARLGQGTKQLASSINTGSEDNGMELLKLRGEVGALRRQTEVANERARVAEQKLADEHSAEVQFTQHETAVVNATKQLGLALRMYLADSGNQYPTDIGQLNKELGGKFSIDGIDLFSLEYFTNSAANEGHSNMVEFRERLGRQSPDGRWRRIYGFSDGSVQTATSNDGNFDAWEKANTYSPPPNPNQ